MGTCTCHARGLGTEDSAEIEVGGAENEVTITRVEEEVTCQQGSKQSCKLEFTVETTIGVRYTVYFSDGVIVQLL